MSTDVVISPKNEAKMTRLFRRPSEVILKEWKDDYQTKTRQGLGDIQASAVFEEISTENIKQDICNKNSCIIIVPNINNDNNNNNKNNNKSKKIRAYRLPLLYGTLGHPVIDIRSLYANAGITTYDPGFMSTSSCHSRVTYIDGKKGILLHRGYKIEDLCNNCDFEELSFLLLYGELPTKQQKRDHLFEINRHLLVHQKLIEFYKGFRYNSHPMAIMCAVVGALSSFYHNTMDITNPDHRVLCTYRLFAKMPTLAAMAYKTSIGEPIVYPLKKLSIAANFLRMMFAIPSEPYIINPVAEKALDKFLMLHADHEQNASTSTVRIAGSSFANPFACIASGITALWGPAHGGANEAVLRMLSAIKTKENIPKFIEKAKNKKDPFRLMGFGHRVYKNYDPRATVMRKMCHDLLKELKIENEPMFELAMELEKIALNDEYFIKRKLFPNVDFYSGIVLKALSIPVSMYTVLFAVGRCIGWISQWKEMIEDPKQRIGRPRQLYLGQKIRKFIKIENRVKNIDKLDDVDENKIDN